MNIDLKIVGSILLYGAMGFLVSWMVLWGSGKPSDQAIQMSMYATGMWAVGQLQKTGRLAITFDGLLKKKGGGQ